MDIPLTLNWMAPEIRANPYPLYERLRAHAPIYYAANTHQWILTRYDDCATLLKDPHFGREIHRLRSREDMGLPAEPPQDVRSLVEMQGAWMLFKDPPDHTRLRGLVHKAFTPRTVERLRAAVQRLTDSAVDFALEQVEFDLIETLAYPIPVQVIAELMGVPHADEVLLMGWSRAISPSLDFDDRREIYVTAAEATSAFADYLRELAAERRRHPGEDLLSALIAAESEGQSLTERELLATAMLLLVAGHETTVNLIGNGVLALMEHRDQWDQLVADPALARSGVEELLRYDSPVQLTTRYVMQDTHVLGVPMSAGQEVVAILGAANRDPVRFTDPARLDLNRDATGHLAFGSGIHYCVGAPLARLEGQVIFETLARRLPRLQLGDTPPVHRPTFTLRGLQSLPLRAE